MKKFTRAQERLALLLLAVPDVTCIQGVSSHPLALRRSAISLCRNGHSRPERQQHAFTDRRYT